MCQIITIKTETKLFPAILNEYKEILERLLKDKGGDYFSASFFLKGNNGGIQEKRNVDFFSNNFGDWFKALKKLAISDEFKIEREMVVLLFSRQQPEMEISDAEEQPYSLSKRKIAVHGTIHNDKELAKEHNFEIKTDTEVFKYLVLDHPNIQGTFVAVEVNDDLQINIRENGLKIWHNFLLKGKEFLGTITATTDLGFLNSTSNIDLNEYTVAYSDINRTLFASFSGGMDISLSTFYALRLSHYSKLVLNYFDWGSNASQMEKKTLEKYKIFIESYIGLQTDINIIEAKDYFKAFFKIADTGSKISEKGAEGSIEETESPIAYVPYRNSQFALLLASIAEEKQIKNADLLFGLNLSEGMVFMDNSEGWLKAIEEVVKYGGKDFSVTGSYRVLAPYFSRTKTNIIKEFSSMFGETLLNHILNISFSCYYPQPDGSPCGKCGSCILRKKAIKENDEFDI